MDRVGLVLGKATRAIRAVLPDRYGFTDDILETLIKSVESSAQKKEEDAKNRTEELRHKRAESLKTISDEETALKHVINCFVFITYQLDTNFPESTIR